MCVALGFIFSEFLAECVGAPISQENFHIPQRATIGIVVMGRVWESSLWKWENGAK